MRGLLILVILLPALLMAQVPPPKSQVAKPKPAAAKSVTAKPASKPTAAKAKSAAAKSAPSKPALAKGRAAAPLALATDEEKAIYSLGLSIHRSLSRFDLSPRELEIVKRALADAAAAKPAIDLNTWGPKIEGLARLRGARVTEREKAVSRAYLDKAATEPGAIKTESGLVYRELVAGSGASPKATDTVKVHYRGTLVNGTEFDSSYRRDEPAKFALNGVIRCWTEGVQKMKTGGKARLVCPADLAYGDSGRPTIPGGSALIFEIELLEIASATP